MKNYEICLQIATESWPKAANVAHRHNVDCSTICIYIQVEQFVLELPYLSVYQVLPSPIHLLLMIKGDFILNINKITSKHQF